MSSPETGATEESQPSLRGSGTNPRSPSHIRLSFVFALCQPFHRNGVFPFFMRAPCPFPESEVVVRRPSESFLTSWQGPDAFSSFLCHRCAKMAPASGHSATVVCAINVPLAVPRRFGIRRFVLLLVGRRCRIRKFHDTRRIGHQSRRNPRTPSAPSRFLPCLP